MLLYVLVSKIIYNIRNRIKSSDYKMIELGGNIKLDGVEGVEPAQLIVIKKVVGNFAKQYSEKKQVNELLIKLEGNYKVTASLNEEINEESEGDNLFYVLNEVLVRIRDKL